MPAQARRSSWYQTTLSSFTERSLSFCPSSLPECDRLDIMEGVCHSWAAYLSDTAAEPPGSKEKYLDTADNGSVIDSPFDETLILSNQLKSGFKGKIQEQELVTMFDSSTSPDKSKFGVFVDTQAYIARSEDGSSITLAVRGSESSKDWATNLTAVQTRWEPNTGGDLKRGHAGMFSCFDACAINQGITPMVHLGWYNAFLSMGAVLDQFRKLAKDPKVKNILFCGHSQGGAVAMFCLANFLERNAHEMDMFIRQGKTVKLLTIGQPRVGDLAFVEHVQDLSAKLAGAGRFKVNRIMTGGDACAVFPPQALNYHHFGLPICFEDEERVKEDTTRGSLGGDELESMVVFGTNVDEAALEAKDLKKAFGADYVQKLEAKSLESMDGGDVHALEFNPDALFSHATNTYFQCFRMCEHAMGGQPFNPLSPKSKEKVRKASVPGMGGMLDFSKK